MGCKDFGIRTSEFGSTTQFLNESKWLCEFLFILVKPLQQTKKRKRHLKNKNFLSKAFSKAEESE